MISTPPGLSASKSPNWSKIVRLAIPLALIFLFVNALHQPRTKELYHNVMKTTFQGSQTSTYVSTWHGWSGVERIFVFGDSYTNTDFNLTGEQPSPSQPLGNPAYPESETKGGSTWPLYLSTLYNDSLIQTYNFADFGATVDRGIVDNGPDFTHMVTDKFLPTYVKNGQKVSGWTSRNSLFAAWFGINEINISLEQNVVGDALEARMAKIFEKYIENLETLYSVGARNFLILNLPSMERFPVGRDGHWYFPKAVDAWNTHVVKLASTFTSMHTDITLFGFDTYSLFNTVIDNPAAYSQTKVYKNTTEACPAYAGHAEKKDSLKVGCGGLKIQEYLWHDGLHPTYPIQDAMAEQIAKVLNAPGRGL